MRTPVVVLLLLLAAGFVSAQDPYKLPPTQIVDILDAPPTPVTSVSPRNDAMMFVEYEPHPSIEMLAQPMLRLAGMRINPVLNSRQRTTVFKGILIKRFADRKETRVQLPANARVGMPIWSHDGKRIAFSVDRTDGVEVWTADVLTGKSQAVAGICVNDIFGSPMSWLSDNRTLLVKAIVSARGAPPAAPSVPVGPNVEETAGKTSRIPTYQDLLRTAHDEDLFAYYGESQLRTVDVVTGTSTAIGTPGIYTSVRFSPNENYLLVSQVRQPFSTRVPFFYFARTSEVWERSGKLVKVIADLPVSDEVPTQGVPKGPRNVQWQELHPAKLVWAEALDEGNPTRKVPHRDKLMTLSAPFSAEPSELLKLEHRFAGIEWTSHRDHAVLSEVNRDKRWRTTALVNLLHPAKDRKVLFDLSINDVYNDPGRPVMQTDRKGGTTILQDGDWVYLTGRGASEQGDRPFLDRLNVKTLKKERLFQSDERSLEQFLAFVDDGRNTILTRFESKTQPPNFYIVDRKSKKRTFLTDFIDPAPELTGIQKELLRYNRPDGVALSGTLYLPPGYKTGTRLPTLIWAYPLEYSDPATAGQVRSSPNAFTFLRGTSPLFFLTQGYAVLMDATMPVVGDPETMNDTFVDQIVSSAKAAIDKLDSMGVADRSRMFVSGHSYGAFMTANLLAHSDLFAAGIARSGAYNRSLTPFGFQSERRSFWEATETYTKVSPFTFANKINEPLLLIHGEMDNNQGTHPIQSDRLYQAVSGHGGTVRLVMLPYESHGYSARESVLHVIAEMLEWADKYVKNRVSPSGRK